MRHTFGTTQAWGSQLARKIVIALVAVGLLVAASAGYTLFIRASATKQRSASDRAAAIAAVGASEPQLSQEAFVAPFWNPTGDFTAQVEVQREGDSTFARTVTVQWDPSTKVSRVLSIRAVAPK